MSEGALAPVTMCTPHTLPADATLAHPPCFDDEDQWRDWNAFNVASTRLRARSFCEDCTPQFQSEMLSLNLCAHPETKFFRMRRKRLGLVEIEVVGRRGQPTRWELRKNRWVEHVYHGEEPPV